MKTCRRSTLIPLLALVLLATSPGFGQGYPKVPSDVKAAEDKRHAEVERLSNEAFERALPEIKAWEAKGKPYIPGAAKPEDLPQAKIPAFPGAWGGGMYSFGGRAVIEQQSFWARLMSSLGFTKSSPPGGKVIVVTNLNDSGPGSLREACETGGPRIVVFNVAGIIQLKTRISVRAPYITIAGNTAPGDGVCIAGDTFELNTHDIVVRHMRFRRGKTDAADRDDSFGGNPIGNLIIDHVSTSWSLDENLSMYRHMYQPPTGGKELKLPTVNVTIQNSISSESLNIYHHAFGSTIGGLNSTFQHNLWASNTGRNPSVGMYGDFTFVNNVLFNYHHRTVDGGDHMSLFNIFNNYFKPGPGTPHDDVAYRLLKPESERSKTAVDHFGKAYVNGNIVEGYDKVTQDNWDGGVQPGVRAESLKDALAQIRVNEPFKHAPLEITDAATAYQYVLANVGATLPHRDAVDERIINSVRTNTVVKAQIAKGSAAKAKFYAYEQKWIDQLAELVPLGFITDPSEVGGYPDYKGTPYKDTDGDGMPDEWEIAHGLNPKDASDALKDSNGDGYTNIEKYIYGLDPRAPKTDWTNLKNNVDARNQVVTATH